MQKHSFGSSPNVMKKKELIRIVNNVERSLTKNSSNAKGSNSIVNESYGNSIGIFDNSVVIMEKNESRLAL